MKLKNKNVLITGGSRGIGKAIALGFAKEGANVAFNYKSDKEKASETQSEIESLSVASFGIQADIATTEGRHHLFQQALACMDGKIHILVNNAGILTRTKFLDITEEQLTNVINVNLIAPFLLSQLVAKHMCEQTINGSIINISSISAFKAANLSHYECSKAGLTMLTKSMALELAPDNIRVNCILPGLTATDINRHQWQDNPEFWEQRADPIPLGRPGTPNDYVGAATFLASDDSSWMTGADLIIDGGVCCR